MPRTVESIVSCHKVAAARRAARRPIWDARVNIKGILDEYRSFGDDLTPAQAVELSGRLLTAIKLGVPAAWLDASHKNFSFALDEVMEVFANATVDDFQIGSEKIDPVEDLNHWLDVLYDWGDAHRVWIG